MRGSYLYSYEFSPSFSFISTTKIDLALPWILAVLRQEASMFVVPLTIEDTDHRCSTLASWTRPALSVVVRSQIGDCKSWSIGKDFESLSSGSRLGEISLLTIGRSRSIYSGLSGSDEVERRFRSTVGQTPKANLACACR